MELRWNTEAREHNDPPTMLKCSIVGAAVKASGIAIKHGMTRMAAEMANAVQSEESGLQWYIHLLLGPAFGILRFVCPIVNSMHALARWMKHATAIALPVSHLMHSLIHLVSTEDSFIVGKLW
jgi:hypothetical protein